MSAASETGSNTSAKTLLGTVVVQLQSVVALLGTFPALAGADLQVSSGEVLLLQGPNGAGKTTLLRVCGGLVGVSEGTATVMGHDVGQREGRRMVRRSVGLMGHETSLYDDLTVRQNVEFWAAASRAGHETIEPALERAGLAGRLSSVRVAALSAGQRRRTAIAVLLCRRPGLWLLDEPHAGLDSAGRELVNSLVVDAAAAGATVMIASHDLDWASSVATRTVNIVGGQVQ